MNMGAAKPNIDEMHDCHEKDRFLRIEKALYGNGHDGLTQTMARLDVRVTWILRMNWFLVTSILVAVAGLLVHVAVK